MTPTVSALSQEMIVHKMAAKRGYRLYQWPSGAYCLVSAKTRGFVGPGENLTLSQIADYLDCIAPPPS